MSEGAGRLWLTVAALATAATAAVAVPGAALLADARRPAFLAGCGVALAAALAGAIPLALEAVRPGRDAIVAVGKAALARVVFALAGALLAILGGGLEKGPLLLGLAGSYVVLLGAETAYLLRWWRRRAGGGSSPAR